MTKILLYIINVKLKIFFQITQRNRMRNVPTQVVIKQIIINIYILSKVINKLCIHNSLIYFFHKLDKILMLFII